MFIQVKNLTARPVSLPGPLPRLLSSDFVIAEITPEEYDRIKDELGILVNNSIVRVFMEVGGSFLGNFTFDDKFGTIEHKGIIIAAPGVTMDGQARVTSDDTVSDYLQSKIVAGNDILLNVLNPSANEELQINVTAITTPTANRIPKANGVGKLAAGWIPSLPPIAHASTHQDGGTDEINVGGLSGTLADPQVPSSHVSTHQNGGTDEINVGGLSGTLADPQVPSSHTSTHQDGGTDEINVGGLSGTLADPQVPSSHASTHLPNGSDSLDTAAAGTIQIGDTANTGTANSFARSDHRHAVTAPIAPVNVNKSAAATGTNVTPSRADHKHDIDTAIAIGLNADSTNAEGNTTTLARSNHTHAIDTTNGNISTVNANDSATEGTGTGLSRRDHQHAVSTAAPAQGIGGGNAEGTATSLARSDHNHTIRETGGPTNLTVAAIADGQLLRRSGTTITSVAQSVFGNDYQTAISTAQSTTTNAAPQDKISLTTPSLTGTYRISWHAVTNIDNVSNSVAARLYNSTDTVIIGSIHQKEAKDVTDLVRVGGFAEVIFTGTAKTFIIQWYRVGGTGNANIQDARIEIWRVS